MAETDKSSSFVKDMIVNMRIEHEGVEYQYKDICAKWNGECYTNSLLSFADTFAVLSKGRGERLSISTSVIGRLKPILGSHWSNFPTVSTLYYQKVFSEIQYKITTGILASA